MRLIDWDIHGICRGGKVYTHLVGNVADIHHSNVRVHSTHIVSVSETDSAFIVQTAYVKYVILKCDAAHRMSIEILRELI